MAANGAPDVEAGTGAGPQAKPVLGPGVSMTGREAKFGDAEVEVERILRSEKNYYYVLKVRKDTPEKDIKMNYFKLSRLVHPDKCKHPQAAAAAAVINQAYDTLTNTIKKMAYDAYVDDVHTDAPEGMSYAEWEATHAHQQVQLPKWLETFLRLPGSGIILLLILFPLTLIALLLVLVLMIVCIPINCLCRCLGCGPPPPQPGHHADDATAGHSGMSHEEAAAFAAAKNAEARRAGATAAAPPQQAPPGKGAAAV